MNKKIIGWLAAAIIIAAIAAAGLNNFKADTRRPAPAAPAGSQAAEPRQTVSAPEKPPADDDDQPRTGRMELAPAAKQAPAAPAADFSYQLKKDKEKERTILPGVTLSSEGKGVNIQLANKDERIELRRNTADPACDYKVMWQKKF